MSSLLGPAVEPRDDICVTRDDICVTRDDRYIGEQQDYKGLT